MRCAMNIASKYAYRSKPKMCPHVAVRKTCVPHGQTDTFSNIKFVPICDGHLEILIRFKKRAKAELDRVVASFGQDGIETFLKNFQNPVS